MSLKTEITVYKALYPARFWGGVVALAVAVVCALVLVGQILDVVPEFKEYMISDDSIQGVYDLAWFVDDLKREEAKKALIARFVGREFDEMGTVLNMGILDTGDVWASLEGTTSFGEMTSYECHFAPAHGMALESAAASSTPVRVKGTVLGYKHGWVIASECAL